jgi:hypothetical protein
MATPATKLPEVRPARAEPDADVLQLIPAAPRPRSRTARFTANLVAWAGAALTLAVGWRPRASSPARAAK